MPSYETRTRSDDVSRIAPPPVRASSLTWKLPRYRSGPTEPRHHRRRRAQHDAAARADPVVVPMAVEDHHARSMARDRRQNVGGVHERQGNPVAQLDRADGILDDVMVEQDDPGAFGKRVQDRPEPLQLRTADDADCVGRREVAAGVRIEEDRSASARLRRRDGQREDVVPHPCHLPSSAPRALFGKPAQPRQPLAVLQIVPERGPDGAGHAVYDVDALPLDGIERNHEPEPAECVADTPGYIEASRVGAIDDVEVVVARHEQDARSNVGTASKQVEELYPFGPRAGVGDVAGDEHAIERGRPHGSR